MGKAKIVMPNAEPTIKFGDIKEDHWFIDGDGDLCFKGKEGEKTWFDASGRIMSNTGFYESHSVTPVSVEIKVTYDE